MLREHYLTTAEAGKLIGRSANMIAKLCQAGRLSGAEKISNSWIIPRESVLNYQPAKRGAKSLAERQKEEKAELRAALAGVEERREVRT